MSETPVNTTYAPQSTYTRPSMALREVRDMIQHLTGRLKTIVDAAVIDQRQCKAMKDLIHEACWEQHYSAVREWADRHPALVDENWMPPFPFSYPQVPPPSE